MSNNQMQWNSTFAFLMSMIGVAVGLGNIWRYSYILYSNGGGAFLIPYLVAIFLMGIPFLILEYGVGYKFKSSYVKIVSKIKSSFEIIAWILALIVFLVTTYYVVIIGWDLIYLVLTPFSGWGANPDSFFVNNIGVNTSFFSFVIPTVLATLFIWFLLWFISHKDLNEGIGKASSVLIPLLFILMGGIIIYSLTLPGHNIGISALFNPDWSLLLDVNIWLAAFGQIIFSLSMGQAIATTYASHLPEKSRLTDYVFVIVGANCGFEFCTAIGIFSILGFMSLTSGIPVDGLVSQGTGLIFVVFPSIFDVLGIYGKILGVIFFLCILVAGITSALGFMEPFASSLDEKFNLGRKKAVSLTCAFGFLCSLFFTSGIGNYLLGIVDEFANQFMILILIFVQCIIFAWYYDLDNIVAVLNKYSHFKVNKLWKYTIKYILPLFILVIWILGVYSIILKADIAKILIFLTVFTLIMISSVILTKAKS